MSLNALNTFLERDFLLLLPAGVMINEDFLLVFNGRFLLKTNSLYKLMFSSYVCLLSENKDKLGFESKFLYHSFVSIICPSQSLCTKREGVFLRNRNALSMLGQEQHLATVL